MTKKKLPEPVREEGRICFGLLLFATKKEAEVYGKHVVDRGDTYKGGFFHGMPCGRDEDHDHVDQKTGKKVYAVSIS